MKYAIHFGAVANDFEPSSHVIDKHVSIDGKRYRPDEHAELGNLTSIGPNLHIAGSWEVWGEGPNDERDPNLHLVQEMHESYFTALDGNRTEQDGVKSLLRALIEDKQKRITRGRLADYAVITQWDDWSIQTHMITWDTYGNAVYINRTPQ